MPDFQLIQKLNDPDTTAKSENSQIEYQQYELNGTDGNIVVLIPIKECENFEHSLEQITERLYPHIVRELLRKHRGVKNLDNKV